MIAKTNWGELSQVSSHLYPHHVPRTKKTQNFSTVNGSELLVRRCQGSGRAGVEGIQSTKESIVKKPN